MDIHEEKVLTKEINLNQLGATLNESWLHAFGSDIKMMLDMMGFGVMAGMPDIRVKGNRRQVQAFAGALKGERSHMNAAKRYGLTDPHTYQTRSRLQRSIKNFEQATGIPWPIN